VPGHMQGRPFLGSNLPEPCEFVFAGRDRMDERYDCVRTVTDGRWEYIRNYQPLRVPMPFTDYAEKHVIMEEIRRLERSGELPAACARYLSGTKPAEELYDLKNDPHEQHNLAGNEAQRTQLEKMRSAHEKWRRDVRDLGLIPEVLLRQLEREKGTQFDILRDANDPVARSEELIRAAEAAPDSALHRLEELSKKLAADERGAAVESLAVSLLESREPFVPLAACDIIDRFRFRAPRVLAVLERFRGQVKENEYVARLAEHIVTSAVP
jgi:hypothetical protein